MSEPESWLPNLVGGVSIWKLAPDLNDPKFMDGRLLEPETEGSDSLPARVTWDLTGLVALPKAREKHPEQVQQGIADFFACLENVTEQFEDESSGYHKFKEAFTVPGLDADDGGHYFFDPDDGKLYVINWGATPRSIKQEQAFLFGYGSFGKLFEQGGMTPGGAAAVAGSGDSTDDPASAAEGAAEGESGAENEDDDEKDGEDDQEGRPWWVWLIVAAVGVGLVVLLLLLLQQCGEDPYGADADAGTGDADAAVDGAAPDAADDASDASDAADDASDASDAADDAGDAEAGAGGGDAGKGDGGGGGASPAAGVTAGSGGACGGTVVVVGAGSGAGKGKPKVAPGQSHRAHYHPKAIAWRVAKGHGLVEQAVVDKKTYHVLLKPGASFEGIRVQWQDRNGGWHDH